MYIAVSSSCKQ